jgi:hypothetical protein
MSKRLLSALIISTSLAVTACAGLNDQTTNRITDIWGDPVETAQADNDQMMDGEEISLAELSNRNERIFTGDEPTGNPESVQPQVVADTAQTEFNLNEERPVRRQNRSNQQPIEVEAEITDGQAQEIVSNTLVSRKISSLRQDMRDIRQEIQLDRRKLNSLRQESQNLGTEYYEDIAFIQAKLQNGTTPGNPRLVRRLKSAQQTLDRIATNLGNFNVLANQVTSDASLASFLLESVRATYGLSGAVEEDHQQLQQVEDQVNQLIVEVDRLLNETNDSIQRQSSYIQTERNNLQTLSLAISNGELFGQNLSTRAYLDTVQTLTQQPPASPDQYTQPLMVIRFDRDNVEYEQALYEAVNAAVDRFPSVRFEVVAVSPSEGNPAQSALAASDARDSAQDVFRTLTQIGIQPARIEMTRAKSVDANSPEVHLYLR